MHAGSPQKSPQLRNAVFYSRILLKRFLKQFLKAGIQRTEVIHRRQVRYRKYLTRDY